jgi:hypothetical protein
VSWVSIDDNAPDHRKQLAAGPAACWLWVCGLCYANRQPARDGFIPEAKALILYPLPNVKREIAKLVEVKLWDRADGGYQIHDYADYQPNAAVIEARREARSAAGRAGGKRSGEVRRGEANEASASKQTEASASSGSAFASNPLLSSPLLSPVQPGDVISRCSSTPGADRESGDASSGLRLVEGGRE